MKTVKVILLTLMLIVLLGRGYVAWILLGSKTSKPNNYKNIGDIPTTWQYEGSFNDDVGQATY